MGGIKSYFASSISKTITITTANLLKILSLSPSQDNSQRKKERDSNMASVYFSTLVTVNYSGKRDLFSRDRVVHVNECVGGFYR